MWIIAGLGNPGPKYSLNRHNVGFLAVDFLADRHRLGPPKTQFRADTWKAKLFDHDVFVMKPLTFMNRSGQSVAAAMDYYKVSLDRVLVIHDELDLPFAQTRLKLGGGLAGHNGLRSIAQQCRGNGFVRLRMGIGRPSTSTVENYVLSDFCKQETAALPGVFSEVADIFETILREDVQNAMNRFNRRAM